MQTDAKNEFRCNQPDHVVVFAPHDRVVPEWFQPPWSGSEALLGQQRLAGRVECKICPNWWRPEMPSSGAAMSGLAEHEVIHVGVRPLCVYVREVWAVLLRLFLRQLGPKNRHHSHGQRAAASAS